MRRQYPAALTPEDEYIFGRVHGGWYRRFGRFPTESFGPDRRDADLMLEAQQCAKGGGPASIDVRGIACRGYNEHGYWIEDTEDGEGIWLR
jgi:hypothetical protein